MLNRVVLVSIVGLTISIIFSITLAQGMVGVLAVLWIWKSIDTKELAFKATPLDLPFLMFIAARILSILVSTDVRTSSVAFYTEVIFYVSFYLMTQLFDTADMQQLRLLIRSLLIAAAVASVIGMVKYASGVVPRASSTTAGYYTLGGYLCIVLTVALFLGTAKEFIPLRWIWMVSCVLLACGIIFTFDRLHWVGMAIVVLFVGVVKERRMLALFLVGGIALAILSPSVAARLDDLVHVFSRSSDRDVLWRGAFAIWDQHPILGFGPRTFREIFPFWDQVADKGIGSWHNDFLQIYMESGIVGLSSLLWLFASASYVGVKTLRSPLLPEGIRPLCAGLLCSVALMFLVGGVIDLLVGLLFRIILALLALMAARYLPQKNIQRLTVEVT